MFILQFTLREFGVSDLYSGSRSGNQVLVFMLQFTLWEFEDRFLSSGSHSGNQQWKFIFHLALREFGVSSHSGSDGFILWFALREPRVEVYTPILTLGSRSWRRDCRVSIPMNVDVVFCPRARISLRSDRSYHSHSLFE